MRMLADCPTGVLRTVEPLSRRELQHRKPGKSGVAPHQSQRRIEPPGTLDVRSRFEEPRRSAMDRAVGSSDEADGPQQRVMSCVRAVSSSRIR